jgi:hypothetical protein
MSKHTLTKRKSVRPNVVGNNMLESLEGRQLMSVTPTSITNGTSNSTVFDANTKTLHVIYYDTATKSLDYQSFGDDGSVSQVQTIDATGDSGQYLSLAEDSGGILHAAYYDAQNGDLKYARRDLSGVWSTTTIDSKNTVGLYPSITMDANNEPVISYYYKNGGDLRMAKFDGAAWNLSTIATTNDIGRYSSLELNPVTNKLALGFEDTTMGHFMYAEESGTGWAVTTVDAATKSGGGYISLNFNNGLPAMSYYDAFNADLKYSERSSRGKWSTTTVAAKNSQGLYTNLAFTFDTDEPAIVYYNKTSDSAMLAYRKPDGVWNFETQLTGGGRNVTPADGVDNGVDAPALYLVWNDTASGMLKVDTF